MMEWNSVKDRFPKNNEEDYRKEPKSTLENYKKFHYCEIPEKSHLHGPAIDNCNEDEEGYLFVANGEYGSQVNFCPMCGYKAKKGKEI